MLAARDAAIAHTMAVAPTLPRDPARRPSQPLSAYAGVYRDAWYGTATIRDGVRYLPLPHPSGVSRWLNEQRNVAAVGRARPIGRRGS